MAWLVAPGNHVATLDTREPSTVGSHPACTLVVKEELGIALQHYRIVPYGSDAAELQSLAPLGMEVYLNGQEVDANEPVPLSDRDTITTGNLKLIFRLTDPALDEIKPTALLERGFDGVTPTGQGTREIAASDAPVPVFETPAPVAGESHLEPLALETVAQHAPSGPGQLDRATPFTALDALPASAPVVPDLPAPAPALEPAAAVPLSAPVEVPQPTLSQGVPPAPGVPLAPPPALAEPVVAPVPETPEPVAAPPAPVAVPPAPVAAPPVLVQPPPDGGLPGELSPAPVLAPVAEEAPVPPADVPAPPALPVDPVLPAAQAPPLPLVPDLPPVEAPAPPAAPLEAASSLPEPAPEPVATELPAAVEVPVPPVVPAETPPPLAPPLPEPPAPVPVAEEAPAQVNPLPSAPPLPPAEPDPVPVAAAPPLPAAVPPATPATPRPAASSSRPPELFLPKRTAPKLATEAGRRADAARRTSMRWGFRVLGVFAAVAWFLVALYAFVDPARNLVHDLFEYDPLAGSSPVRTTVEAVNPPPAATPEPSPDPAALAGQE